MNLRRRMIRTKRKLVKLTGTRQPREDLRKLVALHTLENPEHVLRMASPKKLALETKALQKKFPEIGRRVAKKPAAERIAMLKKIDSLGKTTVENGLKKGVALQEMLKYADAKSLADFLGTATSEMTRQLKQLGLSQIMAMRLSPLIERHGFEKTAAFVDGIKRLGHDPNKVSMITYLDFYQTGTPGISWTKKKPEKLRILAETANAVILQRPGRRTHFVDFKRYGKPLFSRNFRFSKEKRAELVRKGISPFSFVGKTKRIVSSNIIISHGERHAFYMEVPEIASLVKESNPKRQHLRNALAYADIHLFQPKEGLPGRIHIFELQSDIAAKLGQENRERYKSWPELEILGLADFATKNGFGEITLSSPHLVRQVWPSLGKRLTQQLYYDLPKKMGFELLESKVKLTYIDSAFGQQQKGKSGVFWFIKTNDLKKRFPKFFK